MAVQATIVTSDGRVLQGMSYRMSPSAPPLPSVPASPYPFNGGTYHIETPLGWVDLNESQVTTITVTPTAT